MLTCSVHLAGAALLKTRAILLNFCDVIISLRAIATLKRFRPQVDGAGQKLLMSTAITGTPGAKLRKTQPGSVLASSVRGIAGLSVRASGTRRRLEGLKPRERRARRGLPQEQLDCRNASRISCR